MLPSRAKIGVVYTQSIIKYWIPCTQGSLAVPQTHCVHSTDLVSSPSPPWGDLEPNRWVEEGNRKRGTKGTMKLMPLVVL